MKSVSSLMVLKLNLPTILSLMYVYLVLQNNYVNAICLMFCFNLYHFDIHVGITTVNIVTLSSFDNMIGKLSLEKKAQ